VIRIPARPHPFWASLAFAVGGSVLGQLLGMVPAAGLTEPLFSGFYVGFLIVWTIPAAVVSGLLLGLFGRFAPDLALRAGLRGALSEALVVAVYAAIAGVGFAVIFGRLWTNTLWWGAAFGVVGGVLVGTALVHGVFSDARRDPSVLYPTSTR
jgi:hypothetical protein